MDKSLEQFTKDLRELVLEVRQYLCNTEFAPEPFKEPIDADVLTKEFPDKFIALMKEYKMGFVDEDKELPKTQATDILDVLVYKQGLRDMYVAGW